MNILYTENNKKFVVYIFDINIEWIFFHFYMEYLYSILSLNNLITSKLIWMYNRSIPNKINYLCDYHQSSRRIDGINELGKIYNFTIEILSPDNFIIIWLLIMYHTHFEFNWFRSNNFQINDTLEVEAYCGRIYNGNCLLLLI